MMVQDDMNFVNQDSSEKGITYHIQTPYSCDINMTTTLSWLYWITHICEN